MICTINLSDDFAGRLADFVFGSKQSSLDIARTTIILPTKRACRNVKEAFIRKSDGDALLLPKLVPLYELDDLEQNIPPVIDALHRTFLLAELCAKKPNVTDKDQALKMAVSLAEVLDELYQFEVNPALLRDLVPEQIFAEHWNQTLTFLDIIITAWPKILAEKNLIDAVDKNVRLMNHFAEKWRACPPREPIIMAGFYGTVPAIRRLIQVVDGLPNGAVFLHGVDARISPDTYAIVDESHFQFGFKKLLNFLNIKPADLKQLAPPPMREQFIFESLKPAQSTDTWQNLKPFPADTLQNVMRIDCADSPTEALAIALILREALEKPAQTAALVTNDRNLARRVIVEMRRWGVELNDTAGKPLTKTEVGIFLTLIAAVGIDTHSNALLSLLKHPLTADGRMPGQMRQMVKAAEKSARKNGTPLDFPLTAPLTEFKSLFANNILTPFVDILKKHLALAESLATTPDMDGATRLWNRDDGAVAFEFLTDLLAQADMLGNIEPATYPAILEVLLAGLSVRPRYGTHPRLSILGPIESRLYHPDICVIGGLNEGSWPTLPDSGPWINRLMRQKLGLPALEEKIAESALDFAHNFCAPMVYLTRALKADGVPTIPSRFLSRMDAVIHAAQIPFEIQSPDLAALLDQPEKFTVLDRPAPCPPIEVRPRHLSVTEVRTWMSDPYAIYAKHILKLRLLDDLESNKKAANFGSVIHDALHQFLTEDKDAVDAKHLLNLLKEKAKNYPFDSADLIFMTPKFERIAGWFADEQKKRAGLTAQIFTEQSGAVDMIPSSGKPFNLSTRADRIDILNDNTAELIDYKTGSTPTPKSVEFSYEPQLPLEAYVFENNGFKDIPAKKVSALKYWKINGRADENQITDAANVPVEQLVEDAVARLMHLINAFDQASTPYEACPLPERIPTYNDYEHLERVKEWIHAMDGGGE